MGLRGIGRLPTSDTRLRRVWDQLTELVPWVGDTDSAVKLIGGIIKLLIATDEPLSQSDLGLVLQLDGVSLEKSAAGLKVRLSAAADTLLTIEADGLKVALPGTVKGDIFVWDGTQLVALPVGADGQVLIADATANTGLRWGDLPVARIGGEFSTGFSAGFEIVGGFNSGFDAGFGIAA